MRASFGLVLLLFAVGPSYGSAELSVQLELEYRNFFEQDLDPDKFDSSYSGSLQPELEGSFNEGNTYYEFVPFVRWDSEDEQRDHGDIRELNLVHVSGNWETLLGISKVFWGVAESVHLVDIVNQTDYLEGFDGEDKLGQPMVRLSRAFDQTTLDMFVLPGFREREFLSQNNPLSLPFPVSDDPIYESADGDDHVDYAVRFSGYKDIVDYGFSWFSGTSRDPDLVPGEAGVPVPFYPQINQLGLDLQVTSDAWLWKLEAIHRMFRSSNTISGDDYSAVVGGLEYTFFGMADGLYDLGLLLEYHNDSRGQPTRVQFQNDLFLATRFGFTDAESSEVLAGMFLDLDDQSQAFRVEANRRVFGDARVYVEAQVFSNMDPDNVGYHLRNSDFVRFSLELYF